MNPSQVEIAAAGIFAVAVLHTFSTKFFERLAHSQPSHAGIWHLLGEVEAVFGFWAMVLVTYLFFALSKEQALSYVDSRNFTEPLFVFAVMVISATRPILQLALSLVQFLARLIPLQGSVGFYFVTLSVVPLMGSLITEPAAMTLAAIILSRHIYSKRPSNRLMYATLGVLFVNISIGGTLTSFAAPPVLMVAKTWGWDMGFMLSTFGWRAALAVGINALLVSAFFSKELVRMPMQPSSEGPVKSPMSLTLAHIVFLVGVVYFAHHPALFMGIFLFFLGVATAYSRFQDRLILKEGLMVAFFLAGLVVLGGLQQWWLQPLLMGMTSDAVYFGATALTAITDNAALTYLGSLVEGLSPEFKYALVAGAVTGGGLTIIANAPNPAGATILKRHFHDDAINPGKLFLAALGPTLTAIVCFKFL